VAVTAAPRRESVSLGWLDRVYRAAPLGSVFFALCALYVWEARSHTTPWLFTDEIKIAELSRSIAHTGHATLRGEPAGFTTLWVYLLAPFWWLHDTAASYAAIKYFSVLVMTASMFPAYFLARMLVRPPASLFAAAATAAIPSLAFSSFLLEEPLAYPWATLCFLLIAKALIHRSRGWIAGAVAASLVAPLIRTQLALVIGVFVLSALLLVWWSERARAWRATWTRGDWLGAIVIGVGALILFSALASHSYTWKIASGYYRGRMIEYGLWAAGAFTIGVGVLPVVVALAGLVRPRDEPRTRELRAFQAILLTSLVTFWLYTAAKAAYLSTVFATRVEERNLIYLSPLLFVATALWFERPRVRLVPLACAVGFVAYLIVSTPYQMEFQLYSDALGFAILQMANRNIALTPHAAEWVLVGALVLSVVLLLLPRAVGRRRRIAAAVAVVAAGLVLAWNVAGQVSAGVAADTFSRRLIHNFPTPADWLDQATGRRPSLYLGQNIADPQGIWLMEFWNPSLKYFWSLDGTVPGPGAINTPDLHKTDGQLYPEPNVDYVVADAGVDPVGRLVYQPSLPYEVQTTDEFGFVHTKIQRAPSSWRVYRIEKPFRLRSAPVGIFSDGWTGAASSYSQFSTPGNRPGFLRIGVSRAAWKGPDKPGHVTIRVGRLVIGHNRQPAMGRLIAVRRWTVHRGSERTFTIPVPRPPLRVEVTVDPTFSPTDYGFSDQRELGAQISYGWSATPPGNAAQR
jgi:hypothetical protein